MGSSPRELKCAKWARPLLKDVLKAKFGFRYHEIQWRNSPRCASWHVEITDLTEDGVKELLESFGYTVHVADHREAE